MKIAALLVGFAALTLPSQVRAWGKDGHRAVSSIAWDGLQQAVQQQIKELLDIQTREQFSDECNWADDIRRERRQTSAWHFIDSPPGEPINLTRDCPAQKCIVAQIERTTGLLKSSSSKAEKAEALKFLAHFVGDIQQPLHVAIVGNQGGNSIRVRFQGKFTNLHAVWDARLLEAPVKRDKDPVVSILRGASTVRGPGRRDSYDSLVWARESRRIALSPATDYNDTTADLDADYVRLNYPIAIEQIKKAGVRLARLLNSVIVP